MTMGTSPRKGIAPLEGEINRLADGDGAAVVNGIGERIRHAHPIQAEPDPARWTHP